MSRLVPVLWRLFFAALFLAMVPQLAQAQNAGLDAWIGQSPMTVINGQTFWDAAGFDTGSVLYDSEREPSVRWSPVQKASAHFPVIFGSEFHVYGYLFAICGSKCPSFQKPGGYFFVFSNGPDYQIDYAGIDANTHAISYCRYAYGGWACQNSDDKILPTGQANDIAQAIDQNYQHLNDQSVPPYHYDPYQACLDEHIQAYCDRNVGH